MNDKIIHVPDDNGVPCPHGMGYLIFEKMQKYKDSISQIDIVTGEKDSYSKLLLRCIRTALELKSQGITRDDIIALNTNNHMNSFVPFVASQFLGCRIASLDPSIPLEDTRYLLEQVNPRIIFTTACSEHTIIEATKSLPQQPEIVVFGTESFDRYLSPKDCEKSYQPVKVDPTEVAVILFSSGTTGLPKGILCNHRMLIKSGSSFFKCMDAATILSYSTPFWISAIMALTESCINGTCRLLPPKFDPAKFWCIVEQYKATVAFTAPTQIVQILKNKPNRVFQMDSLTGIMVGGGPVPAEYLNELKMVLPTTIISQAWGQSELGIVTKFFHTIPKQFQFLTKKPLSCGLIVPGYTAKVVDPETNSLLGVNQVGEIRIKSVYQMNGYHNKDSSEAWDDDGYICTGDLGYYDEDKCFFIVDRIKEMLKYQSWHVTPVKIESILLKHPAVSAAVVIGKPHNIDGDHPLALVVLNDNNLTSITEEELQKYADAQLDDRHKLRGGVIFMNKLLYTASGKFKRAEMRKHILNGLKSF